MLQDLIRGNFLSGYKTYAIVWSGIALTWLGFAVGVDLLCALGGILGDTQSATCAAPTFEGTVKITGLLLGGATLRKAVYRVAPIEDGPLTGIDPRG